MVVEPNQRLNNNRSKMHRLLLNNLHKNKTFLRSQSENTNISGKQKRKMSKMLMTPRNTLKLILN